MIRRLETFRRILPLALGLLLPACGVGCSGAQGRANADLAPPIAPSPDPDLARRWYHGWENEGDLIAGSAVRDMSFTLTSRGRDWRPPGGPDGHPVRVFLLNSLDQYVREDGSFQAFLVHSPFDPYRKRALYAWSVSAEAAKDYFRQDRVAGYLLRLDWGQDLPPGSGTFMLVIRWSGKDGNHRITRNIVFPDRIEHAITTTTSRPKEP